MRGVPRAARPHYVRSFSVLAKRVASKHRALSSGDRSPIAVAACTSDRGNDLLRTYDGTGVVRDIDVECGVHHLVRVIRRRVLHHGNVITELGGIAHSRFDAGMRNESDDDELMDAVLLELQVQVGVGEATGTPVFLGDNLTWRRREFGTELTTPCAVFEALVLPGGSLNRRNVGPRFVVACTISMMHGIEYA